MSYVIAAVTFFVVVFVLALVQGIIGPMRLTRVEPYRTLSSTVRVVLGVVAAFYVFTLYN